MFLSAFYLTLITLWSLYIVFIFQVINFIHLNFTCQRWYRFSAQYIYGGSPCSLAIHKMVDVLKIPILLAIIVTYPTQMCLCNIHTIIVTRFPGGLDYSVPFTSLTQPEWCWPCVQPGGVPLYYQASTCGRHLRASGSNDPSPSHSSYLNGST